MDARQTALAIIAREAAGELIGGMENVMLDSPEDSQEYQEAKTALDAGHDTLVSWIVSDVSARREAIPHLKFAGNAFLEKYVSSLLTKWNY